MPFVYIASPYTHPDAVIRHQRYLDVCNFTKWVALSVKITPYSPIVHWHEITHTNILPYHADFWKKVNYDMLREATSMYVLAIDGWNESKGVANEVMFAVKNKINTVLASPQFGPNNEPNYHITPLKYKIMKTA